MDDNRDAVESLAMLLRLKGNEVRTARDGRAALQSVGDHPPDVVFIDIGLPGMSGYAVAREMRRMPSLRGAVLVAVTGKGSDGDRTVSEREGFHAHLVKPVDPAAVEQLLAGLPDNPTAAPRFCILIVDDEKFIAESFAAVLNEVGHEVATAEDGPGALAAVETFRPDVVLLDLGLPHMIGYDVARHIRGRPLDKRVFLIALTGCGQEEDHRRTKEAGFDYHLIKPVRAADVLRLLATLPHGSPP